MPAKSGRAARTAITGPQGTAVLTLIGGIAAFALLVWGLPQPLVLPAISILLLAASALIALVAWRRPRPHQSQLGYWDLAGALTLIGIAAALLSEPDQVVPLLETAPPRASD